MEYGEETGLAQPGGYAIRPASLKSISVKKTTESSSEESLEDLSLLIKLSKLKLRDGGEEEVEEEPEEEYSLTEEDKIEVESLTTSSESSIVADVSPWIAINSGIKLWKESDRPVVKLLSFEDLVLDDEETNGVLSDRMIACGLSYLSQNPTSKGYILAKLIISGRNLQDISILGLHPYLQYIDLSRNNLTDLTPLGRIPYLIYLDVSHNQLSSVLRFKAPKNLTFVNYSYNNVVDVDDLTDFWSIVSLDLSHNEIVRIDGLQNLKYLRILDLAHNKIQRFENLNRLRITELYLQNNEISTFEEGPDIGMKTMKDLVYININNNRLRSLALFKDVYHLRSLKAMNNNVTELLEADSLCSMRLLYNLDLSGNPLVNWPSYRSLILNMLNTLTLLDGNKTDRIEKVTAKCMFAPNLALIAARSHARVLLLEQINGYDIDLDVLPVDQGPFPLVILVGPPGSKKGYLVRKLVKNAPGKVRAGVNHTTRPPEADEVDGVNYHFVSREEFNKLASTGIFLAVTEILGNSYGFARTELAECVQRRELCLTHMDLIGATALFNRSVQPRLVFTMIENREEHLNQLRAKYIALTTKSSGAVDIRRRILLSGVRASHLEHNVRITREILNEIIDLSSFASSFHESEQDLSSSNMCPQSSVTQTDEEIMSNQMLTVDLLDTAVLEEIKNKNESEQHVRQQCSVTFVTADEVQKSTSTSTFSEDTFTNDDSITEEPLNEEQLEEAIEEKPGTRYVPLSESAVTVNAVEELNINSILHSRETYISLNYDNPGMFSKTIYTDNLDKAYNKLYKFIKDTYNCRPQQLPIHSVVNDEVYKSMTKKRLTKYMDEIHKHYEINAQQNDTKTFKQPYISQNPASPVTNEQQK